MDESRREIQDLLLQWAMWEKNGRPSVGYPSRTAFDRLRGSSVKSAQIDDTTGEWVDSAVSRLGTRSPIQAITLRLYYLDGKSMDRTGRALKPRRCRREVKSLLASAESCLEWILFPEEP